MFTNEPTIRQLFDLTGKVALLTGGTGHLGRAMASGLAEAGARVVVTSRDQARAKQTAQGLPGQGHVGIALDHTDTAGIEGQFADLLGVVERLDVLVNNAHEGMAEDWRTVTPEHFTQQLGNASAYFQLARLFRNQVVERNANGNVIMIGSMYGQVASYPEVYEGVCPASPVAYHTLKGGILQMTRHLAVYWAADGVRVNCLSPGPFPSEKAPQEMVSRIVDKVPLKRIGQPHELKAALVFLASEASSYMTGATVTIDGGFTLW